MKDKTPKYCWKRMVGAKGSKVFSERVNQYLREREMLGAAEFPFSVLTSASWMLPRAGTGAVK
ncbi:hypothetical protein ACNKHL_13565 [Shigella flexneri]